MSDPSTPAGWLRRAAQSGQQEPARERKRTRVVREGLARGKGFLVFRRRKGRSRRRRGLAKERTTIPVAALRRSTTPTAVRQPSTKGERRLSEQNELRPAEY